MPTLHQFGGLRVVVHTNDHRPSHVHVVNGNEAIYKLNCPDGPPELRENFGFRSGQLNTIEEELSKVQKQLCDGWKGIHGDF